MSILGLDWNATRALAVLGTAGDYPLPVPLEPPALELPMLLDLAGSRPVIGATAQRRCRVAAHQVCQGFLPWLGAKAPTWKHGRRALDAAGAVEHVWQRLHAVCRSAQGVVIAVPSYLQPAQAELLGTLGGKGKLPILGSVPSVLAAALAGHTQQLWTRAALVVDVDDHALTVALVLALPESAHLVETRCFPGLGLRAWRERLINALADLCVWQTRRDPRAAPMAEQGIYDQLDSVLDACQGRQPLQLAVQASQWYHHLLVQPEHTLAFCSPLASQAAREVEALGGLPPGDGAIPAIVLTHAAGRLPGLRGMLAALAGAWAEANDDLPARPRAAADDFGEDLLFDAPPTAAPAPIAVLAPDALARAAHGLAEPLRQSGRGHLTSLAPLPLAESVESGPARLHWQGRDYLLQTASYTIGSHPSSQLVLDHPDVAARHCSIIFDRRTFVLLHYGESATFVNDAPVTAQVVLRAGDRIRLGMQGPVLRFLGRAPAKVSMFYTTA